MFAVIKSGGRQYKVSVGEMLEVNQLPVEAGAQVKFEEVLLISDADRTMIGKPLLDNAMVLATAVRQGRGKKVIIFKYKPKKRQRHRRGHRQELTFLTIDDIVADGKSLITGEAPKIKTEETPAEEEVITTSVPVAAVSDSTSTETETEETSKTTRRRRVARAEGAGTETTSEDTESKAEE